MSIQKKTNSNLTGITPKINNMIFDAIYNIQNGSVTIIKQDKTVIQINVSEKINFDNQLGSSNFVEEAVI
jgi:hypothetical protein